MFGTSEFSFFFSSTIIIIIFAKILEFANLPYSILFNIKPTLHLTFEAYYTCIQYHVLYCLG